MLSSFAEAIPHFAGFGSTSAFLCLIDGIILGMRERELSKQDQQTELVENQRIALEKLKILLKIVMMILFVHGRSLGGSINEEIRLGDFARAEQMQSQPDLSMGQVGDMENSFNNSSRAPLPEGVRLLPDFDDGAMKRKEEEEESED